MCGICGICSTSLEITRPLIKGMTDSLVHRGPDDDGVFVEQGVGFGSRRLAILDLSPRGHMPMTSADGRYVISYNGEIFNFQELREELVAAGVMLRSDGDTEVVLELYARLGAAMLPKLNGMFAFAIWDRQKREAFLARDRLGVKPLYYHATKDTLRFGSEQKAIFASGIAPEFDESTWFELLCFRYVGGERTSFSGVQRLLPGHTLTWKDGQVSLARWWCLADRVREVAPPANPVDWFHETLMSATKLRRISDVPVGVLVSGGLDSGSLAALLGKDRQAQLNSFTVRFREPEYDEGPLARAVAERWGFEHHEVFLPPANLMGELEEATWFNDDPLAHGSDAQLYAISKYAKSRVTVLIAGEGADEVLGGYVRYRPLRYAPIFDIARKLLPVLPRVDRLAGRAQKLRRFLELGSTDRWIQLNACDVLPDELPSALHELADASSYRSQILAEAHRAYPDEPFRQVMYVDAHTFLPSELDRGDRMTMGASIECRLPFMDYRLVEGLAAMSSAQLLRHHHTKHLLRKAMSRELPESTLKHRKWGFGVPWALYMRTDPELRAAIEAIPDCEPMKSSPLPRAWMEATIRQFLAGDSRMMFLVRQLLMIAIWHRVYFSRARALEQSA